MWVWVDPPAPQRGNLFLLRSRFGSSNVVFRRRLRRTHTAADSDTDSGAMNDETERARARTQVKAIMKAMAKEHRLVDKLRAKAIAKDKATAMTRAEAGALKMLEQIAWKRQGQEQEQS